MANPPNPGERIALVAITRHGIAMGGRLAALLPGATLFAPEKFGAEAQAAAPGRFACYAGKTGEQIPALFAAFAGIVAIVSLGAVVRLIAPHLGSKESDPAVVVVDEAGKFAIPVLSGHLGGELLGSDERRAGQQRGQPPAHGNAVASDGDERDAFARIGRIGHTRRPPAGERVSSRPQGGICSGELHSTAQDFSLRSK